MKVGDIVESADWRDGGRTREVTSIPEKGSDHYGYCFLKTANGKGSTRVRLKKNGIPERYRLIKHSQTSMEEE